MSLRILPVNYLDQVTNLAVSPAAVATLPITNLQSPIRDRVWRSPTTDPQTITGDWGGNVRQVSAWGIFPALSGSSLVGAQVRVQLFQDLARTTQVYDSGNVPVFTFSGLGWGNFNWGATPWGCDILDRTVRQTPLVLYFAAVAASAFTITVSNTGALDTPYFEARRFWIADYIDAPYNANVGAAPQWKSGSAQERSIGGSLRRTRRARWRELRVDIDFATETDRSTWSDIVYSSDPANEIVVSLFPGLGTKQERDFTVMGSLEALNPLVWKTSLTQNLQLAILES